jgi:hypothetical protein
MTTNVCRAHTYVCIHVACSFPLFYAVSALSFLRFVLHVLGPSLNKTGASASFPHNIIINFRFFLVLKSPVGKSIVKTTNKQIFLSFQISYTININKTDPYIFFCYNKFIAYLSIFFMSTSSLSLFH